VSHRVLFVERNGISQARSEAKREGEGKQDVHQQFRFQRLNRVQVKVRGSSQLRALVYD